MLPITILAISLAVCGYLGHLNWQAVNERAKLADEVKAYVDRKKKNNL